MENLTNKLLQVKIKENENQIEAVLYDMQVD